MLFKKNKITAGINDSKSDAPTSSDFETLDSVKQRKKERSLINRLFVKQYHDAVENLKEKKQATKKFFQTQWFQIIQWSMFILLFVSMVMGLCIMFEPFTAVSMSTSLSNGGLFTPLNNIYTAKVEGGLIYGLTGFGIAYTVINIILLGLAITWCVFKNKEKSFLCMKSKATKIISIVAYCLVLVSYLFVVIVTYVPPIAGSVTSDGMQVVYLRNSVATYLQENVGESSAAPENAQIKNNIVQLAALFPSLTPTVNANSSWQECVNFFNGNSSAFWPSYETTSAYCFYQNLSNNQTSTINAAGYSILVIASVLFLVGLLVLPLTDEIIKVKEDIRIETNINWNFKEDMNWLKRVIVKFCTKTNTKFFTQINKIKNKDTYRKYKKEMSESGMTATKQKDSFKTENTTNAVSYVITKEEIEKHEANKAFLNSQGQYMYHDGNHNYFIVKNDQWVPYNIEEGVHQAQVNIETSRDTDLSKKKVKERKWFKHNKAVEKISEKVNKNKAAIDLPDEELNKIIGELDI